MHCKLRQPDAAQSLFALIGSPCQVWSRSTFPLVSYSVFYCSYVTLRCDFELWPRDLDLWPLTWTFVVCRLCRSLYQISAQSSNPRQSYCSLNIWPYDLEHVSRAPLCCGIVCTKFKLNQAIRSWNVTIFDANTSWHAMTLTFDPLTLNFCCTSSVMCTNSIKFERNRTIRGRVIDDIAHFCRPILGSGAISPDGS